MRLLFSMILTLILLPIVVHAQLFVSEYNVTYTLGEGEYEVEEVLLIKNGENPFIFPSQIEIFRGDAEDMEAYSSLYGSSFIVDYEYPTRFVLSLRKAGIVKEILLVLKYKRKEGLFKRDEIGLFAISDMGTYPWGRWEDCVANPNECKYMANIRIVAPRGYQFGNITPPTELVRDEGLETLVYSLTLLENITIILNGFSMGLEYADYTTLAVRELTSAKTMLSQSYFTINDANLTLINAKSYDVDVERASYLLAEAVSLYEEADSALALGEQLQNAPGREYYRAYLNGVAANDLARRASGKAAGVKNMANFEIQNILEKRIKALASNLSQEHLLRENLSKALTENLSQRLRETETIERVEVLVQPPPPGRNYYAIAFFILLGGVVLYVVGAREKAMREETRARGTVSDFRVIADLKRKSFKGFERKVDIVKREVGLATEIRGMRKDREKCVLGIENLRKKKIAGEIKKRTFESEKAKFEKQIADIDAKLEEREAQLWAMKEKGADEASKAD
ncbi:MAG: hypothetical protein ACE5G7_03010 [Candidatus Hydrothermarchaeaceae archaeon]